MIYFFIADCPKDNYDVKKILSNVRWFDEDLTTRRQNIWNKRCEEHNLNESLNNWKFPESLQNPERSTESQQRQELSEDEQDDLDPFIQQQTDEIEIREGSNIIDAGTISKEDIKRFVPSEFVKDSDNFVALLTL